MTTFQESDRQIGRHRQVGRPPHEVPAALYMIFVFLGTVIGVGFWAGIEIMNTVPK